MNKEQGLEVVDNDAAAIKGTSIGYALSLVMDYGNGRQMTLSGALPLRATLQDFNAEMDKFRKATNRQQAYITVRNRQAQLAAEKKMVQVIDHMVAEYDKESDKTLAEMEAGPTKNHTLVKTQVNNMRQQVASFKQSKLVERSNHQGEVEICEVIIANAMAEIAEMDKEG